jgi:Tfp pilus assembly protein FimT
MLIICTVLGAAAPSLRGFFVSRQTDDVAARIISLTRLARSKAVTEGRVYRLLLDARSRTIALTAQGYSGFASAGSNLGRPSLVPADVELELEVAGESANRDYIEFYPDGRTEQAVVRLTDIKGSVIEVRCAAPTELFTVRRGEEDR